MNGVALRNALDLLLDDAGRHRADEAAESWGGLLQLVQNNCQTHEDLALVASVLLITEDSLLQFLTKSLEQQGKGGSKVREAIFKYLETFLTELGPERAQKYCNDVIHICLFAFKREDSNPAKGATFLPLHCILEWHLPVPSEKTAIELAKAYQNAYQRVKTITGTVKGDILQTLGHLLEARPQGFTQSFGFDHLWLLNECTLVLQTQSKANKPDQGYMAGALAGLSLALPQCKDDEVFDAQEVAYQHIRKSIYNVQNLSRYHGLRAALGMLAFQAYRFQEHLLDDSTDIINRLIHMKTQHANKDVRDRSDQALSAVFHQLAERMMSEPEGAALQKLQTIHKQLLGQLTQVISSPQTSSREVAVAVAGIGELAPPTRRFFDQQGVAQLLRHLTPLVQQGNLVEQLEDVIDDKYTNEVALLVALAKVLAELDTVEEAVLQQCLHVIQRIVQAYRGLWPKQRLPVHAALNIFLSAIAPKQAVLQSVLPRFVSILLTYTLKPAEANLIAGPLAVAANQNEDVEEPWSTYLHLWQAILQGPAPPKRASARSSRGNSGSSSTKAVGVRLGLHAADASAEAVAAKQQSVYDALMRAIMDAVRNLDLEYHQADGAVGSDMQDKLTSPDRKKPSVQDGEPAGEPISADIGTGLVARNLGDMRAFINLADFVRGLLPACGPGMFKGWAYLMTLDLVAASGQRPLLSGFYRMLTVTMRLTSESGSLQPTGGDAQGATFEQVAGSVCLEVYRETLRGVVTACRRYKDELLESCLELLLSAPSSVMTIHELVGPLQAAFSLGLQYPPLAKEALAALERWEGQQPQALSAVAPRIVPLLNPYLLEITDHGTHTDETAAEGIIAGDNSDETADEEAVVQGEAAGKEAYKRVQASSAAAIQRQKAVRSQGLKSLQPRIQAWLGRAAAAADALVVQDVTSQAAPDANREVARWDSDNKLGLTVPFPEDTSLIVWLDKTLPQVSELAEKAADRSTRVAACEFLHAVTLWMIGVNARRPEGSKEADFDAPPTQFHTTMQKLFPVLLSLACAAESVARQLFEPLVMSLVHWLTRSARRESAETVVLLEAILDGLSDEKSGAKRELCANAAREFFLWSAKHIPMPKAKEGGVSSASASSNLNAASLVRRLFERLAHPEAYQRLGAAQAMARCADAMGRLSDLNDVSDAFYLEAVSKCVGALRAAEHDAEGTGTKTQVADALAALVRVPLRRTHLADSLKTPRTDRQGFVDLAAFLGWLWKLTVVPERYCRDMCMWLMDKLTTIQMEDSMQTGVSADDDKGPVAVWFRWQLQEDNAESESEAIQKFLTVQCHLENSEAAMSLSHLRLWIQAVEASVSWASWALRQQIVTPSQLRQLMPSSTKPSKATPGSADADADEGADAGTQGQQTCMLALLDFLSMIPNLTEAAADGGESSVLTGCERDTKHLAFKALTFLQQIKEDDMFSADLPALHNFLLAALLAPAHLGVTTPDAQTAKRLATKAKELIEEATLVWPDMLPHLQRGIAQYLSSVIGTEGQGKLLVSNQGNWEWGVDLPAAATLLQGLTLAADLKLPQGQSLIPAAFKADLPQRFLSLAANLQHNALPQQQLAAEGALNLALRLGIPASAILDKLIGPSCGESFYESYRTIIHTWVMFNASSCAGALFDALAGQQAAAQRVAEAVLTGCLVGLQRSRDAQGRADIRHRSFLSALLPQLPKLASLIAVSNDNSEANSEDMVTKRMTYLHLLAHLLKLDAQHVLDPSLPSFSFTFDSYCNILTLSSSAAAVVQQRVEALQLLQYFLKPESYATKLTDKVQELVISAFPASSWEWRRGTTQSTDYARQLMAIMDSMVAAAESGLSVEPLLQAVLPILKEVGEEKGHVRQDALVTRLILVAAAPWKVCIPRTASAATQGLPLSPDTLPTRPDQTEADARQQQASSLLEYAWKHVFELPEPPIPLRRAFLYYVLLPCLKYSPLPFQHIALQERAQTLLGIINGKPGPASDRLDEEASLLARTGAYKLVQYIYEHIDGEDIKSRVLGPAGGEQVHQKVIKAATADTRGLPVSDGNLEHLARETRCAAFACGSALVAATQKTNPKIFAALFLKEQKGIDPAGPWKELIDTTQEFKLSVELDETRRTAFKRASNSMQAVAKRIKADRSNAASLAVTGTLGMAASIGSFASQGPSLTSKISASQYSLGDALMDGSQAGFSSSVDNVFQQSLGTDTQQIGDWQDDTNTWLLDQPEDSLAVEDDDLDRHDCMLPLVHLIERAAALFPPSNNIAQMPDWMARMHVGVGSSQVPKIVRLFLVKAVLHVERRHSEREAATQQQAQSQSQASVTEPSPGVFGHFAAEWFPAMMSAVLGNAEEAAEEGIHYLLLDVCLMCLTWHTLFPAVHKASPSLSPQVKLAADALMDYLVRAAYNPQRQIVNNNFNLIKAFIHHWRAAVPLPLPALLSLLGATPPKASSGVPDARAKRKAAEQRCVAMKLLAAGLMYGQSQPLMTDPDFKTAVKHVLDCLATKGGQMLAQQSGECMGVILAQHHKKSKEGVHLEWGRTPEELEKEVKHILLGVHSKGDHDRFIYCLERLTAFHKPLIDTLRAPLLDTLPRATGMLQSLLLEILQRRAAQLPNLMTDVKPVLPALLASHNHALQNKALQLIKALLPAQPDITAGTLIQHLIQGFANHSSSDCRQQYFEILRSAWQLRPAMHAVLRPALLVMLGDPDSQLRAEALSFWDSALPKAVSLRLQALLQDSLAEPAHLRERLEAQWAQSAAALLLELPKGQRAYTAATFDRELAECKFAEYPIDTYGKPTLGMAPLFSSQWSASQEATQSQEFVPGLGGRPSSSRATAGGGPTPFTQAAAGMVRATVGGTVSQSFSLALSLPQQDSASLAFSPGTATGASDTLSERTVVRRRFNRSAGGTSEMLGRLQRRRAAAGGQAVARERKVSLMRKYRTGELPDVQQLSVAAFLAPLGVMASRDANIARTAVEAIWHSVCHAASQASQDSELLEGLRLAVRQCFERQPKHAGYVRCLQSFALADRGGGVDVTQVAQAAKASDSLQAGVLQIEEQMLFGLEAEAAGPPAKRQAVAARRASSSTGSHHPVEPTRKADATSWSAVAEVYAQLGQDDLVQVIYAKCLSRCPGSEVAMQALTGRKVDLAFRVYQALLGAAAGGGASQPMDTETQGGPEGLDAKKLLGGNEPLKEEEDMWFRQQNRCMEALGMWEDVLNIVDDETGNDERRLFLQDETWDGSQYIRPFVRSCLFQPVERERLSKVMQQAATQASVTTLLENNAVVEIAAQAAISRQWDRCQALVSRGWGVFREKWGALHPLTRAPRLHALATLQPLAELQEVVTLVQSLPPGTAGIEQLQATVARWSQRWPSVQQPTADACLTVIHVRGLLLDALMQEWPRDQQHQGQTVYQILSGLQGEVTLGGAACLARQGFLDTAQDLLSQHRASVGPTHLPSLQAQLRLRIAQVDANPGTPWLYSELSQEVDQLSKLCPVTSVAKTSGLSATQHCQLLLLQAEAHQYLAGDADSKDRAGQLRAALQLYQQAAGVKPEEEGKQEGTRCAETVAEASLRLAFLCNDLLQNEDAASSLIASQLTQAAAGAVKKSDAGLEATLVRHMMHAMQLGGPSGQEAQLYVPRLLSVIGSSEAAGRCFGEAWHKVPLPFLLPWVAQMLSLLDAAQGEALLPPLKALAKQYPQQMYFPFNLSRQHYGPEGQARADSLQPLLSSPVMEQWGAALNDTTYPAQRWEGWVGRLSGLIAAGDKAAARALYKDDVYPDMITNHVRGGRLSGRASGGKSPPATVNSAFAAKWESKFKEAFGPTGDKISSMPSRDFEGKCARLGQAIKQETDQVTGKRDLARLSHWFEAFGQQTGGAQGEQLVLPHMPNVNSSSSGAVPVHVVSFGKMVDVFSSKQRPKKLTIYGDDFKKHEWIVKGGEEVRIDQRIEQLFDVMNGLMHGQPGAAVHSLQVRTYDVVPITPSLGMVAFVAGTTPLKALLTDPALIPGEAIAAADEKYSRFIMAKGGNLDRAGLRYEKMFRAAGRQETVAHLQSVQSLVRWDSLREALLRVAGGPELFLSMRGTYTASLAAVSMAGYVAGVGDRHTDNFLVDLNSGALVPIDFGYSFGTAVQVLPIPELMPFRLTRQMSGALQPHDALALLQPPCTLVMTALRSGKDILEGIMGVFMREPLLDWQREARVVNAKRSVPASAKDAVSAAETADPADMHVNLKVDNARRKLAGEHPADIMLQELATKHGNTAHWQALQAIVKGDANHNYRATVMSNQKLNVDDQVRCLLDQATDPNILGRSWQGWKPWL